MIISNSIKLAWSLRIITYRSRHRSHLLTISSTNSSQWRVRGQSWQLLRVGWMITRLERCTRISSQRLLQQASVWQLMRLPIPEAPYSIILKFIRNRTQLQVKTLTEVKMVKLKRCQVFFVNKESAHSKIFSKSIKLRSCKIKTFLNPPNNLKRCRKSD